MPEARLKGLLDKLAADPDNTILRIAAIRTLSQAGEISHAVSIAFDLDETVVTGPTDRAAIAEVFERAGMQDDAVIWRGGAVPALSAQEDEPVPANGSEDETPDTHSQTDRRLKVVAGTEAGDDEPSIELPPAPDAPIAFADVGGLDTVKKDIQRRIIAPFQNTGLLSRFKRKAGGGVLLYGPPGCGKTLIARATAGECNAKFHSIQTSDVLRPLQGQSESLLAAAFDKARADAPSVLFFDEVDALASKRSEATSSHIAQLVSVFLTELDGVADKNGGVLVLAATNLPWAMDAAFLRPGRFDRLFFVPPPDRVAREAILRLELADLPQDTRLDIAGIAARTSGLSGADLADLVSRASDSAIDATLESGHETPISQKMLARAATSVRSSVNDWLTTARNFATYANESGRYDDILDFLNRNGR